MSTSKWAGMFGAIAGPTPDPLADVEYTGNLEADAATELDSLHSAFIDRRKQEDKRFRDATDSEYWFAVCFRNRAEKEAFLAAIPGHGSGSADKYLDGRDFAARLNIEIGD